MISFRTRTESIASSLIILAVLMLVGTAVWFSKPLPTEVVTSPSKQKSVQALIEEAKTNDAAAEVAISSLVWDATPEQVGPQALTKINELVKKHGLKLVAFRPQKAITGQGLTQIPFGLTLDGPFPNTLQFVKELEQNQLKLAVTTVQVASADQASDRVTGTVNLAAFIRSAATPAATGITNAKKS